MLKLNLDRDKVDECREIAESVVHPAMVYIHRHSTWSIERAVLRLLGFEGTVGQNGSTQPMANAILDKLSEYGFRNGVASRIASIKKRYPRLNQQKMGERIVRGEVNFERLEDLPAEQNKQVLKPWIDAGIRHIDRMRHKKDDLRHKYGHQAGLQKCMMVASGDVNRDIDQALWAAEQGATAILVGRSTGQSLLDHVPAGETFEGAGGTYATQENFRLMREALDEFSEENERYVRLVHDSSGLCMAELSVLGASEGLDALVHDALYGTLFRDINVKRNLVDQYFSKLVLSRAGMAMQTSEDQFQTRYDRKDRNDLVLASLFINEALAKEAGLKDEQVCLTHAFCFDPATEDSLLHELTLAQLIRELFPRNPIKYLPRQGSVTHDPFLNQNLSTLFYLIGSLAGHDFQVLIDGASEGLERSFQEKFLAFKTAESIFKGARSIRDEMSFTSNGMVMRQSRQFLDRAHRKLSQMRDDSLFDCFEKGRFGEMSRKKDQGRGYNGVFERGRGYFNPFYEVMSPSSRR